MRRPDVARAEASGRPRLPPYLFASHASGLLRSVAWSQGLDGNC
jgi:hypothetical protein